MLRLFLNIGGCILRSYSLFIGHYKEFYSASTSLYFFSSCYRDYMKTTKFTLLVTFRFPGAAITPSCSWRFADFERGKNPFALWCHPGQWAVHCKWKHADRYSSSLPGLPPEHPWLQPVTQDRECYHVHSFLWDRRGFFWFNTIEIELLLIV